MCLRSRYRCGSGPKQIGTSPGADVARASCVVPLQDMRNTKSQLSKATEVHCSAQLALGCVRARGRCVGACAQPCRAEHCAACEPCTRQRAKPSSCSGETSHNVHAVVMRHAAWRRLHAVAHRSHSAADAPGSVLRLFPHAVERAAASSQAEAYWRQHVDALEAGLAEFEAEQAEKLKRWCALHGTDSGATAAQLISRARAIKGAHTHARARARANSRTHRRRHARTHAHARAHAHVHAHTEEAHESATECHRVEPLEAMIKDKVAEEESLR
jgi:hypothetical protein